MSLPMRERGLKPLVELRQQPDDMSLPMRERGLKLAIEKGLKVRSESLPMRERGLKLLRIRCKHHHMAVAPHAGAWIETR